MPRASVNLSGVAETLLITLYFRAVESQRPDALVRDEQAVELISQLDYDFSYTQAFLAEHPDRKKPPMAAGAPTPTRSRWHVTRSTSRLLEHKTGGRDEISQ